MQYIKIDTINSTNDFLKNYQKETRLDNFFYVFAGFQTNGRGQRSNTWQSDCCKNVLMSILIYPEWKLTQQKILNQIISLSIIRILENFNVPGLQIKLPNDILADGKKIAGILIENVIYRNNWKSSVVGIGLNVNQTDFVNLPGAVSMKNLTGRNYDVEKLVHQLAAEIKQQVKRDAAGLQKEFENRLITN